MAIRVALEHRTSYHFDAPVTVHPHLIRLRPAPHSRTPILAYSLTVRPQNHFVNWQQDPFGNYLARLVFPEKVTELDIAVDLVADLTTINPFDFFVEEYAESFPFSYPPQLRAELQPYLAQVDEGAPGSGPGELVRQWIADHLDLTRERRIVDFLVEVNRLVHESVDYTVRLDVGVQTPDATLERALGSCRDSAWLLVSVLRQLGLAARFVSGYLVQLTPDDKPLDGPAGPAEDFTDLHAWAEVFVPGAGWIGLDATSGLFAGEGHIPLAATPHPISAAPIEGATAPVGVSFEFSNRVTRIWEDARVTAPYTDSQWEQVDALGQFVDERLEQGDVRLTMGGEPTFVSAVTSADPQWESAADGREKRALATVLAERLRGRLAEGGIVHHGQGKWYPGEPLPRWQIQLAWREDGIPLWNRPTLLDDPWGPPVVEAGSDAARERVAALAAELAQRLGIPADFVVAAYDDPIDELWRQARQPWGERPKDIAPDDVDRTLVDTADATVASPRGWAIPLFRSPDGERWATARWRMRRRHLFLTPGTSPMGYRLPLDSLAWNPPPQEPDRSPFAPTPALPEVPGTPATPAHVLDIEDSPRHALCIEERGGHIFVFLTPLSALDDALELLAAIEAAAAATGTRVVLEGYHLPGDARLRTASVTPDPGVIEVNVAPSASWSELRDQSLALYDDARACGLSTEKFDLDGHHTGTGGGNHFTLGGRTPADSPLLRRPDLLRSLVTYWQHHPSLSYVFSGRFIGPTSQAPRVDEGRHETLYELEIAFAELERVSRETPVPWLTDRLLRHLLTDLTGNTHRAEFCIDKLYSPDSERGRLGLLELRGFEMPPHARMALVQALLIRALVARFWEQPYSGPLVRWGSRLHDRFLLPAFAAADLADVVADLNAYLDAVAPHPVTSREHRHVPRFDEAWLEPFLEFRFPRLGEVDVAGVHLELRQAIEPWHVLGEEVALGGTTRYVDSSVERVQVAATGLIDGRHVVTCNGIPLPMTPTGRPPWGPAGAMGRADTAVAGVRYRAWAPWSALHPTIGVHSPLVFDLVDRWNGRSLGGFTYHVVHPGGRNYDSYPVNALEAEARRSSRFVAAGHTPGPIDSSTWPAAERLAGAPGSEYPTTLDLRRFTPGVMPRSPSHPESDEA